MRWILLSLFSLGCTSAGYHIQLTPVFPSNQSFNPGSLASTLIVRSETGDALLPLAYDQTFLKNEDLIDQNAFNLGVALESVGGNPDRIEPSRLIAYGESGTFTFKKAKEPLDSTILLPAVGGVGDLMRDNRLAKNGVLAIDNAGQVWWFGEDTVLKLWSLDQPDWVFENSVAMPDITEDGLADPRFNASLVQLNQDSFLLVGGSSTEGDNFNSVSHFDPFEESFLWSEPILLEGRETPSVFSFGDRVLVIGGNTITGYTNASTERIDTNTRTSTILGVLALPNIGFSAAVFGEDRVLVCGGALANDPLSPTETTAVEQCIVMGIEGSQVVNDSLPIPLQGAALLSLSEGRLLLTGGSTTTAGSAGGIASSKAYLFDSATSNWTEVGSLNRARAHHQMALLPDGRAIVFGGSAKANFLGTDRGEAISCPEIFDPSTNSFELGSACGNAGSGAFPIWSASQNHGLVLVSPASGAFGIVGFGPSEL